MFFLLPFFVFISSSFYAQEGRTNITRIDTSDQIFKEDTFDIYRYFSGEELLGYYRYLNGQLESSSIYSKQKSETIYLNFYENGKPRNQSVYLDSNLISSFYFYEKGNIKSYHLNDYISGIIEGKEYYESGELMRYEYVDLNDTSFSSKTISYDKKGNITSNLLFGAGKQKAITYNNNGLVVEEYTFINVSLSKVGEFKFYYWDTGVLREHGFYKDSNTQEESNIRVGTWRYYSEKGNLTKEKKYKNGELVGAKEY